MKKLFALILSSIIVASTCIMPAFAEVNSDPALESESVVHVDSNGEIVPYMNNSFTTKFKEKNQWVEIAKDMLPMLSGKSTVKVTALSNNIQTLEIRFSQYKNEEVFMNMKNGHITGYFFHIALNTVVIEARVVEGNVSSSNLGEANFFWTDQY